MGTNDCIFTAKLRPTSQIGVDDAFFAFKRKRSEKTHNQASLQALVIED